MRTTKRERENWDWSAVSNWIESWSSFVPSVLNEKRGELSNVGRANLVNNHDDRNSIPRRIRRGSQKLCASLRTYLTTSFPRSQIRAIHVLSSVLFCVFFPNFCINRFYFCVTYLSSLSIRQLVTTRHCAWWIRPDEKSFLFFKEKAPPPFSGWGLQRITYHQHINSKYTLFASFSFIGQTAVVNGSTTISVSRNIVRWHSGFFFYNWKNLSSSLINSCSTPLQLVRTLSNWLRRQFEEGKGKREKGK